MRNVSKIWDMTSVPGSLLDGASFMCVRTNPKLTTNVRLVTNGSDIWLDAYPAAPELSEDRYRAWRVTGRGLYNEDVARFWKGLDPDIPYTVAQEYDDTTVKTSYDAQYETMYWCGAEYISSLEYDEEFGFTAPLWLDGRIPDMFVVFRVDDPSYWRGGDSGTPARDLDFRKDILGRCRVVRTFDLTENSVFGAYIRRYRSQEGFPEEPLHAVMKPGGESLYKGFSILNGSMISAPECSHSKFFEEDDTITGFDMHVTEGFGRNRLAVANLLNIQFLFDDRDAAEYSVNRYFGLYCNFVKDGLAELDFGGFEGIYGCGNSVCPAGDSVRYSGKPFVVENPDGVVVPFSRVPGGDDLFPYADVTGSLDSVFCFMGSDGSLHSVRNGADGVPGNPFAVRFADTSLDLGVFTGFVRTGDYVDAVREDGGLCSQASFEVMSEIPAGAALSLVRRAAGGDETVCTVVCDMAFPDGSSVPGWHNMDRFCGTGTPSVAAHAIAMSLNESSPDEIEAFSLNGSVLVRSRLADSLANGFRIVPGVLQNGSFVVSDAYAGTVFSRDGMDTDGSWRFRGGTSFPHLNVSAEDAGAFHEGGWLKSSASPGWCRVVDVVTDCSSLSVKNGVASPSGDEPRCNVTVDGDGVIVPKSSQTAVYGEYRPPFGRLSFFPVRDFDFSTYEKPSIYGDIGELDSEYGELSVGKASAGSGEPGGGSGGRTETAFRINGSTVYADLEYGDGLLVAPSGDAVVSDAGNGEWWVEIPVEITNLAYSQTTNRVDRGEFSFETLNTTMFGGKEPVANEYDVYLENYSKDCMLLSKTAPFISKWVRTGNSLDVREKPYRLNTSVAFGVNSFAPNPYNIDPSTVDFNQEWEYIFGEYPFNYAASRKSWSYVGVSASDFGQGEDLETLLRSTDVNYFDILFVQDFMCDGSRLYDHLDYKRKYSLFGKGSASTDSVTFFRGAGVEILQKSNYGEPVDNNLGNILTVHNGDLNGYKFTAVAVPYRADYTEAPGMRKIKVIRNDAFKFVAVLVYTAREIYGAVDFLTDNSSSRIHSLRYKKLSRYFMYEPDTCVGDPDNANISQYPGLSVFGSGMISRIEKVVGTDTYMVYGNGTAFLTEFDFDVSQAPAENRRNKFVMLKYLVGNSDSSLHPSDPSMVVMVGMRLVEVKSDTLLVAVQCEEACDALDAAGFSREQPVSDISESIITDGKFVILEKSKYAISDEIRKCTFGNIYYNINHFQADNVEYEHVAFSGGEWRTLRSADGVWSYALRILPPELNAKYRYVSMTSDNRHIYYNAVPDCAVQISRYGGYYMPLFRDVLYFKDPFLAEAKADPSCAKAAFLRNARYCNTVFAGNYEGFGVIRCLNFHRANSVNNNVFRLSDGEKPLLPIQNKFTVGHRPYNVFLSNWDPWYFTETESEIEETYIHGTASMKEKPAMLGSKCMKTPDAFVFDTFTYMYEDASRSSADVVAAVGKGGVTFSVDVRRRLAGVFRENLRPLFEAFVSAEYGYGDRTTLDDDIDEYIESNLLSLYTVDSVTLYVWRKSSPSISVDISAMSYDDLAKKSAGLLPDKDARVNGGELSRTVFYSTGMTGDYAFGLSVRVVKK